MNNNVKPKEELDKFEKFLKQQRKKNGDKLVESTIQCYINNLSSYWTALCVLTEQNLVSYIQSELNNKKSEVLFSAFKIYLKYRNVSDDFINELEFKKPLRPNASNSTRFLQSKILSPQEIKILFKSAPDLQTKCLVSVFYDTACRRNEIMSATFGQLEVMKPDKNKQELKDGISAKLVVTGKGRKKRTVYFGKTTLQLLKQVWKEKGKKPKVTDKLFEYVQPDGTPYKNQDHHVYVVFKKLGEKAINREISMHDFRRTKATHLASQGAELLYIQSYLGHEKPNVTMKYVLISEQMGKNAFKGYSIDVSDL